MVESFSLSFKSGESISLVGASGAGKSTIALAIASLLHPRAGRILFNGRSANEFSPDSIRRQIGYLEQNAMIFATDVRTNLKIAQTDASDAELIEVLDRVGLWQTFAERDALDTQVGEHGALISGGEAQRLALARALLADFKLIVLDEPTANVDESQGKKLVSDMLAAARSKQRMLVLITHDAKLAKLTDRVIKL